MYHLADQYAPAYYVETEVLVPSADTLSISGDAPTTEWAYSYAISALDGQVLFRNNLTAESGTPYTYRVWADPITKIPYDSPFGNDQQPKLNPTSDNAQSPIVAANDLLLANYPFSRNDPWLPAGATETIGNNVSVLDGYDQESAHFQAYSGR